MFTPESETYNTKVDPSFIYNINLDMESEFIEIPSKGIYLPAPYTFTERVEVKKLSYQEEDILTTKSYYDNGTLFHTLLKSVIVDVNFPVESLLDVDKHVILLWLKLGAFDSAQRYKYECSCKKKLDIIWDFTTFQFPEYSEKFYEKYNKEGKYWVDFTNKNTEVKFNVNYDSSLRNKELEFLVKSKKIKNPSNTIKKLTSVCSSLEMQGEEIKETHSIYLKLIELNLPIPLIRNLQSNIFKGVLPEISETNEVVCDSCNASYNFKFEIRENFFGLNLNDYRRYLYESINYLHFWGRIDYQSILRMSINKRKAWIHYTNENLKILYPKK